MRVFSSCFVSTIYCLLQNKLSTCWKFNKLNCSLKGQKIWFFWRPPPLPQGLDDQATSFSQGLDPPVNIKCCYIAGISSPTACGLIGYFKVTWYLAVKLFPAKSFWAGNIAKSMTSVGNSALLPANVDRQPAFRFVFTLCLLMSSFCYILTNHL